MVGENESLGTTSMLPSLTPGQLKKAIPVSSPGSHLSVYSSSPCLLFACSNPHISPSPQQLGQPSLHWDLPAWVAESLWHPSFGIRKAHTQLLLLNCPMGLGLMAARKQGVGPAVSTPRGGQVWG